MYIWPLSITYVTCYQKKVLESGKSPSPTDQTQQKPQLWLDIFGFQQGLGFSLNVWAQFEERSSRNRVHVGCRSNPTSTSINLGCNLSQIIRWPNSFMLNLGGPKIWPNWSELHHYQISVCCRIAVHASIREKPQIGNLSHQAIGNCYV